METKVMSSEDFRAHLYQSLQGKGILDSLKSQLRNRLATELHKTMKGSVGPSLPGSPRKSMRVQVADRIVAEYLNSVGYEYSLSIFLPEAGTSMEKLCSEEDLIQFLRISPSSSFYSYLTPHPQKPGDFLERLLEALIESADSGGPVTHPALAPSSPQVPTGQVPAKRSVADRLDELDASYARKAEEESIKCMLSLEDRLSTLQCDLEARYKQQLEEEMTLYRSRELARVREEERDRYQGKMTKEKQDLHHIHQLKLDDAKKAEQRLVEKYHRKEQELEAGIYTQRQTLLGELNSLRVKEAGFKRDMELEKRAVALEKEQAKAMTGQLENTTKQMKARFELMAEEKVLKEKADYELKLKSALERVKVETETIDSLKLENKKLVAELKKSTENQVHTSMSVNEIGLHRKTEDSQLKLSQFTDRQRVAELKQELALSESKRVELRASQKQQQLTIRQLQEKLSKAPLEQVSLQAEIDQLHKMHHKEMLVMEYDNKQLGRQLTARTENCVHLQRRLDEQLVQLRSAQREVQDLHSLLEHTLPPSHRVQRTQGIGKKSHSLQHRPLHHQQSKISTPPPIADLTSSSSPDLKKEKTMSFFDTTGNFLEESRAAIKRMEKEAQELEKTYLDHQLLSSGPSLLARSPLDTSFSPYGRQTYDHSRSVAHDIPPVPLHASPPLHQSVARRPFGSRRTHQISGHSGCDIPFASHQSTMARQQFMATSEPYQFSNDIPTHQSTMMRQQFVATSEPHQLSNDIPTHQSTMMRQQFVATSKPSNDIPTHQSTMMRQQFVATSEPHQFGTSKADVLLPVTSPTSGHLSQSPPAVISAAPPFFKSVSISPTPLAVSPSTPPSISPTQLSVSPTPLSVSPTPLSVSPTHPSSPPTQPPAIPAPNIPVTSGTEHTMAVTFGTAQVVQPDPFPAPSGSPQDNVTGLGALPPFSLHSPVLSPQRTAFSTEISSAGNTTVLPRSSMSLDSWWKPSESPSTSTVKSSAESQAGAVQRSTTSLSMSQAVTHLTTTTTQMAPVFSLAPAAPGKMHQEFSASEKDTRSKVTSAEPKSEGNVGSSSMRPPAEPKSEGNVGSSSMRPPAEPKSEGNMGSSSMKPPAHQESVEEEEESGGSGGVAGVSANSGKKSPRKDSSEDDGLDPVMRKYMQLVQEKRQKAKTGQQAKEKFESHSIKEIDVPPLSQEVSSMDAFSIHDDDPFEDW